MARTMEADGLLASLREARGFSREHLCSELQSRGFPISGHALISYELGKRKPRVDLGLAIAQILEVSPWELWMTPASLHQLRLARSNGAQDSIASDTSMG